MKSFYFFSSYHSISQKILREYSAQCVGYSGLFGKGNQELISSNTQALKHQRVRILFSTRQEEEEEEEEEGNL